MTILTPRVLRVELAVKFRSFGITWGTVHRGWVINLPEIVGSWVDAPAIHFDERGVRLDVWAE